MASLDLQWWTKFLTIVEGGNLTSDPSYYVDGRAQPDEFGNVVRVAFERAAPGSADRKNLVGMLGDVGFWESGVDLNYWINTASGALGADLQNLSNAANERLKPGGTLPTAGQPAPQPTPAPTPAPTPEATPAPSSGTTDLQWWTEFLTAVEGGNLTSDPSYYADGRAQPGELGNVISVAFNRSPAGSAMRRTLIGLLNDVGFWEEGVDFDYWLDTASGSFGADLQNLANAAEERLVPGGLDAVDGEIGGASGDAASGLKGLTILQGAEMKWYRDPSTDKWYVEYGLPGSDKSIVFEVEPDQLEALFGEGGGPDNFTDTSFEALVGRTDAIFGGNVAQMEGDGNFEQEVKKVITLGLEDGVLPEWASQSGEILDLLYIAQVEEKSAEWLINQIATTQSFAERFPNIETLKTQGNLTWSEAVGGFLEFEAGVRAAVTGIGEDPGSVTPDIVGALLEAGHALTTIQTATTNFKRMQDYAPALSAFNDVLAAAGLDPISSLQEMYDFVAGSAPSEVYDVWEASSLAEAAQAVGLGELFNAADAMEFAIQSAGTSSLVDSMNMFQSLSQTLLRFRNEIDLGAFDLNQEDILDMALGKPPASGTSAAQLQANMSRAVSSAQANLRTRGGLFKAFSPEGVPQAAGLESLRRSS